MLISVASSLTDVRCGKGYKSGIYLDGPNNVRLKISETIKKNCKTLNNT